MSLFNWFQKTPQYYFAKEVKAQFNQNIFGYDELELMSILEEYNLIKLIERRFAIQGLNPIVYQQKDIAMIGDFVNKISNSYYQKVFNRLDLSNRSNIRTVINNQKFLLMLCNNMYIISGQDNLFLDSYLKNKSLVIQFTNQLLNSLNQLLEIKNPENIRAALKNFTYLNPSEIQTIQKTLAYSLKFRITADNTVESNIFGLHLINNMCFQNMLNEYNLACRIKLHLQNPSQVSLTPIESQIEEQILDQNSNH